MEQLTGGVAHDFNNLLTAVLGNMELARLSRSASERDELMDEAERAARRGAELTGQLLAMASCARLRPVTMSASEALHGLSKRAGDLMTPDHKLSVEIAPGLPLIRVDGPRLQTCLLELLSNARDAMPDGGAIELRVQPSGAGVCFELRDHGSGIPADLLPLVCEPYFTTKPVGEGSGLGLAILRGFAEQSGGTFKLAKPDFGPGTCARLVFPAAADQSKAALGPAGAGPQPRTARVASAAE
nr:ATP-binding protein [Salipiger mangrovisoli]